MKKVLALVLGMLIIPFAAFGLESMSVDEMAEITGQSGVAIALDDVKVFFYTENEETWYQSKSTFTAADNGYYNYVGSVGLIRNDFGQMLYLNAMLASDSQQGAAGNFTSIGSNLPATLEPNMDRNYMLRYTGTAANNYMGLNQDYGFNFGNKNGALTGMNSVANIDQGFDSKALTIRAVNRAEVLSLGATYRLNTLYAAANALGSNAVWASDYHAYEPGDAVRVAAVVIGLPTVEVHYKRGAGESLEIQLSIADEPLQRNGFDATNQANSDTWSYGKIWYGSKGEGLSTSRTILVLDGFIEITPMEAYANPKWVAAP